MANFLDSLPPNAPTAATGGRWRTIGVAALLGTLLLTGCGTEADQNAGKGSVPATATTPTDDAVEPSPTPTPSSTTDSPSPTVRPSPETLTDRLLPTAEVTGLNERWRWRDGRTGPADEEPFGACAKTPLSTLGALDVVQRSYFPPVDTDDFALQQVAEFPDARTATTAIAVLRSWHDSCTATLRSRGLTNIRVGAIQAVPTAAQSAAIYLASWVPRGAEEGRFHAVGYAKSGTRITVTIIESGGQDYNYAPEDLPARGMITAAAALLG